MKILRVISSMNPAHGGPSQGIRNSIPVLEELGVYNEVVSLDSSNAPFLGEESFPIHAVGQEWSPWKYNKNLSTWLLKNLGNYDVVIIHGLWLYHSFAVYRALAKYKRLNAASSIPKVYVMPHGMLDPYFQSANGRRLKAFRNWLYWNVIERKVVNNADGVLFTCEEELKLARGIFSSYKPKREINVGYGILTPPAFNPSMKQAIDFICSKIGEKPYLLFLGRIQIKKGVDILISAYLRLKSKGVQLPPLVIAGPGLNSEYGRYVQKLASEDGDVLFADMLRGDAKWGAFYRCEAFILPSHQENFGIAIVEALACAKPVLISNKVNIWREIKTHGAGLVEEDSEEGVGRMLNQWSCMSDSMKESMGRVAKVTYEQNFAVTQAAKKMKQGLLEAVYA